MQRSESRRRPIEQRQEGERPPSRGTHHHHAFTSSHPEETTESNLKKAQKLRDEIQKHVDYVDPKSYPILNIQTEAIRALNEEALKIESQQGKWGKRFMDSMMKGFNQSSSLERKSQEVVDALKGILDNAKSHKDAIDTQSQLLAQQVEHVLDRFKRRFGEEKWNQLMDKRGWSRLSDEDLANQLGLPPEMVAVVRKFPNYYGKSISEGLLIEMKPRVGDQFGIDKHRSSIDTLRKIHFDELQTSDPQWYAKIHPEVEKVTEITNTIRDRVRLLEELHSRLESDKTTQGMATELGPPLASIRNEFETTLLKAETSLTLASTAQAEEWGSFSSSSQHGSQERLETTLPKAETSLTLASTAKEKQITDLESPDVIPRKSAEHDIEQWGSIVSPSQHGSQESLIPHQGDTEKQGDFESPDVIPSDQSKKSGELPGPSDHPQKTHHPDVVIDPREEHMKTFQKDIQACEALNEHLNLLLKRYWRQ